MVRADGGVRRADLVHSAEYPLVVSGTFVVGGSEFTAHIADEDGLSCFLAAVTRSPVATWTVRMFLKPQGYRPPRSLPIELPPSSLYFDVDQEHQVAAAGLLVSTDDGNAHQWMTRGAAGRDDVVLVQDPFNPEHSHFPQNSFITVGELRDAVFQWAFADVLTAATSWRPASEWDVRWPVGAGYQI